MKRVYSNLTPKTGAQVAGICTIHVAPIEWLQRDPIIHFPTGEILLPVTLRPGKSWITLDFTQESYYFDQKPKSNKGGSFYEISVGGTTNDLDAATRQLLETLRYHQFAVRAMDRQKRHRLAGDSTAGMILQFTDKEGNNNGGTKVIMVDMMMESEATAPFYLSNANAADGLSPLFLAALNNNTLGGNVSSMYNYLVNAAATAFADVYSLTVLNATESVIHVAIANDLGLQYSEYIVGVDLSSPDTLAAALNNWLTIHGTGQHLQMEGEYLRLVDPDAGQSYMGIAVPQNLLGDDDILFLNDDNVLLLGD